MERRQRSLGFPGPAAGLQGLLGQIQDLQPLGLLGDIFIDPGELLLLGLDIQGQGFLRGAADTAGSSLQAGDKVVGQPALLIPAVDALPVG